MTVRVVYRSPVGAQRGLGEVGIGVYRRVLRAVADAAGSGLPPREFFEVAPSEWKALVEELGPDWPMGLLEPGEKFGPMIGGVVVVVADPPAQIV